MEIIFGKKQVDEYKVKLDDVIEALDFSNPDIQYYYSIKYRRNFDGMAW